MPEITAQAEPHLLALECLALQLAPKPSGEDFRPADLRPPEEAAAAMFGRERLSRDQVHAVLEALCGCGSCRRTPSRGASPRRTWSGARVVPSSEPAAAWARAPAPARESASA